MNLELYGIIGFRHLRRIFIYQPETVKVKIRLGDLVYNFYMLNSKISQMTVKLECKDYGFDCKFVCEGQKNLSLIEQLRTHFQEEHGIEYSKDVVVQMLINRGHSRESIIEE